jgi:hypothetical protein
MADVFGMPFTPTVGKEAFLRGPIYSVRNDFAAPVSRKRKYVFPVTSPLPIDQQTRQLRGLHDLGLVSHPVKTLVMDPWLDYCKKFEAMCKEEFSLQTVHLPVSPLSTLWAGLCGWA